VSELDSEVKAINDIFLEIPEHIPFHRAYQIKAPLPPRPYFDNEGNYLGYDTVEKSRQDSLFKLNLSRAKLDTSEIVLAFYDTLYAHSDYKNLSDLKDKSSFIGYEDIFDSILNTNKTNQHLKLDLIYKTGRFELKPNSEFPRGIEIWNKEYPFKFGGYLSFSRVFFNSHRNKGMLFCAYGCGSSCGSLNIVLIKKIEGVWKIQDTVCILIS
jgi:hypothetical protein